ncbi:MAG: hypothetical protein GY716_15910 [bacterium]|nr:hypothetical protein [bacterium]
MSYFIIDGSVVRDAQGNVRYWDCALQAGGEYEAETGMPVSAFDIVDVDHARVALERQPTLTGSEAVYGFAAWLSTLKQPTIFGSSYNCDCLVPLIQAFTDTNALSEPREHWCDNYTVPPTPKHLSGGGEPPQWGEMQGRAISASAEAHYDDTQSQRQALIATAREILENLPPLEGETLEQMRIRRLQRRFGRLRRDDDGYNYLVPVDMAESFDDDLYAGAADEYEAFGAKYDPYRLDGGTEDLEVRIPERQDLIIDTDDGQPYDPTDSDAPEDVAGNEDTLMPPIG